MSATRLTTVITSTPDDADTWIAGLPRAGKLQLLDEMDAHELRVLARHLLEYAPEVTDRALAERLRARRSANRAKAGKGTA